MTNIAIEAMAIEIGSFPSKHGDFPSLCKCLAFRVPHRPKVVWALAEFEGGPKNW